MTPSNQYKEWTQEDISTLLKIVANNNPHFSKHCGAENIFNMPITSKGLNDACMTLQRSDEAVKAAWYKIMYSGRHIGLDTVPALAPITQEIHQKVQKAYKDFKGIAINTPKVDKVLIHVVEEEEIFLIETTEIAQQKIKELIDNGIQVEDIEVFYSETGIKQLELGLMPVIKMP